MNHTGKEDFCGICYADRYGDVRRVHGYNLHLLRRHYNDHGKGEGRWAGCAFSSFDWKFYTSFYPDLSRLTSHESAIDHYFQHGLREGRHPSVAKLNSSLSLQPSPLILATCDSFPSDPIQVWSDGGFIEVPLSQVSSHPSNPTWKKVFFKLLQSSSKIILLILPPTTSPGKHIERWFLGCGSLRFMECQYISWSRPRWILLRSSPQGED